MNSNHSYKKVVLVIILIAWILWSVLTPTHFEKGGVDTEYYIAIAFFVLILSVLIGLLFQLNRPESIVLSLLFAFISLFLTTLIIGPAFVDYYYNGKSWFFQETKHRIFMNLVYYGLNIAILVALSFIYVKVKDQLKRKNNLKTGLS